MRVDEADEILELENKEKSKKPFKYPKVLCIYIHNIRLSLKWSHVFCKSNYCPRLNGLVPRSMFVPLVLLSIPFPDNTILKSVRPVYITWHLSQLFMPWDLDFFPPQDRPKLFLLFPLSLSLLPTTNVIQCPFPSIMLECSVGFVYKYILNFIVVAVLRFLNQYY